MKNIVPNLRKCFLLFLMLSPLCLNAQTWTSIWNENFNTKVFESCYTTDAQTYWGNCSSPTAGPRNSIINGTWEVANTNLGVTQSPLSSAGGRFLMYWSDNRYTAAVPSTDSIIFSKTLTGLTIGKQYRISFKFGGLAQTPNALISPASIGLRLNNLSALPAVVVTTTWQTRTYTWTANATSMKLEWTNQVKAVDGNDFALDDLLVEVSSNPPLPVILTDFTVSSAENCAVVIRWSTGTEDNFSHFEVERSSDGVQFQEVGNVFPTGSQSRYSFTDANPVKGTNLYRLRMVNRDGSAEYSATKSIKSGCALADAVRVFPTPAHDHLYITGASAGSTLTIYNTTGQIVLNQVKTNATEGLDISHLANGIYLLLVQSNGALFKSRIIKE